MKGFYVGPDRWSGNGRTRGFTMVEIMIVVAIVGLLVSVAVPYFVTYRASAQAKACLANLRQLEAAKEQWALEEKKSSGDPCNMTDLVGPGKHIRNNIECAAGGGAQYNAQPVGTRPTCPTTIPEHVLP
jgi:prepilin-type N-terminal cleavage/methylation domain-containing protein